jgi:hypothetical protein
VTNKVEITIIAHDKTDTGFASAKANATKAGKAYADAYKAEILKGTRGVGAQVSKQVANDMIAGSKGTGEKVSRQFTSGLLAGTKDTGQRVADKFADAVMAKTEGVGEKAGSRFSSEFARTTKGLGRATGTDIGAGLTTSISAGAKGAGAKAGEQIGDEVVKGTKGTGRKVAKDIDDEIVQGTKGTGKKVSKQISSDLDGLHAQALRLNKVFDTARDKNLLSDADVRSMTARFKGIEEEAQASGKRSGVQFRSAFAGNSGGNDLIDLVFKGGGGLAGSAAGAAGIAIGAAVAGGLAVALTAGGVVGLGGFLLKDNEKVKKAWGDTFKDITEDAKRRAGFLEDEFVDGASVAADAWDTKLGPALERIFVNAQPLVDDFIKMPVNWLDALAPGVEKAVKNAGPAVEGLDAMGTAIFKGLGDGLGDLSEHSGDLKVAMEMIGDGVGKTLEGALGFIGDLSKKVADNREAWESWGRGISKVAGAAGTDFKNLMDLAAAASSPDGKNSEGDGIGKALQKLLMGGDYKDAVKGDYNDMRNLGDLGREIAHKVNYAGQALSNPIHGTTETKAVDGSVLDSQLKLLAARKDLNEAAEKANYLDSIGLTNSQGRIEAGLALSQSQAQLVESGNALTESTGNNTQANQRYIEAINTLSAAGLPASDALLGMAGGMNSAELAAMGATVRTNELGQSVISIPGQKDIVVNAGTIEAQNAIAAVQGAVNSLTGKTVYINVITTGVASAASAVAGYASAAAASILGRNKGGLIPGSGPDVDSKLIAGTPGEFVVNRKATNENLPLLEAINKGAGGDTVMAMAGGGGSDATGGSTSMSRGGGGPTVVQLNVQPGRMSGMDRMFLSWVAEALQTNGGMAVNGWKA